jgi:hypothetical protein
VLTPLDGIVASGCDKEALWLYESHTSCADQRPFLYGARLVSILEGWKRSDVVMSQYYLAVSTQLEEIPRVVHSVTARLFRAFGGFALELAAVEQLVEDFFHKSK